MESSNKETKHNSITDDNCITSSTNIYKESTFCDIEKIKHYYDLLFQPRKEEAIKIYSLYINGKKDLNDLRKAFQLNNTDGNICYSFLQSPLSQEGDVDYKPLYLQCMKRFMNHKQIAEIDKEDCLNVQTVKDLILSLLNNVNEPIKLKFVNPYLLQLKENQSDANNTFCYKIDKDDQNEEIKLLYDIRPSFPLDISDEDQYLKSILFSLIIQKQLIDKQINNINSNNNILESEEIELKNEILLLYVSDIFSIIKNLFNSNVNYFDILQVTRHFMDITDNNNRSSYLLHLAKRFNLQMEFSFIKYYGEEFSNLPESDSFMQYRTRIKEILWSIIKPIITSQCIRSLLDEGPVSYNSSILTDENFLGFLNENILLYDFYNKTDFGFTNTDYLAIHINIEHSNINELNSNSPKIIFYFGRWIITAIHEIIGHYLKRFQFFYYNKAFGSNDTPKKDSIPSQKLYSNDNSFGESYTNINQEGGFQVEYLLFNNIDKLYYNHIVYLLTMNNWKQDYESFQEKFLSISPEITKEQLNELNTNPYLIDILSIIQVSGNQKLKRYELKQKLLSQRDFIQIDKFRKESQNKPHIKVKKYHRSCLVPSKAELIYGF